MPTATGAKTTASRSTKAKAKSAASSNVDKAAPIIGAADLVNEADDMKNVGIEATNDSDAYLSNEAKDEMPKELSGSDEVEIVSLIPNVSYYDKATGDRYEWEYAGDVEYMTVDAVQRLRRNARGYFEDMCIKPNDERVIKKFSLGRYYSQYDYLMDSDNYTKENIDYVLDRFSSIRSNSLKSSVVNKIKSMISDGELSDVSVIRSIEKRLDIDLISLL